MSFAYLKLLVEQIDKAAERAALLKNILELLYHFRQKFPKSQLIREADFFAALLDRGDKNAWTLNYAMSIEARMKHALTVGSVKQGNFKMPSFQYSDGSLPESTVNLLWNRLIPEDLQSRIPLLMKQFPGYTEDQILDAATADPTGDKYVTWILRLLKAKTIIFPEDKDKVRERLDQFQKLSRKPAFQGAKDINQYKTFGDLAKTLDANSTVKTKGEVVRDAQMAGSQLAKEEGDLKIFKVTTPEAAAKLFRRTEWCVKDPKMFNDYAKRDPDFWYLEKGGVPWKLLNIGNEQCKGGSDDDASCEEFLRLLPPDANAKLQNQITRDDQDADDPWIGRLLAGAHIHGYTDEEIESLCREMEPLALKVYMLRPAGGPSEVVGDYVKKHSWKALDDLILRRGEDLGYYEDGLYSNYFSELVFASDGLEDFAEHMLREEVPWAAKAFLEEFDGAIGRNASLRKSLSDSTLMELRELAKKAL